MTLEIRHFVNSFFVITTNEISMALDPWCTSANGGGWHAVPILDINSLVIEVQRCDAIFISHIHNDHFSPDFLSKLDLSSKTIFIKNFRSKALLNQLQALQPKRVIELAPWVPTQFSDIELTVIPQAKTTSGGHEIDYEVDVDTSLLI